MKMKKLYLLLLIFGTISGSVWAGSSVPDSAGLQKFNNMQQRLLFMENKGKVLDQCGEARPDILFLAKLEGMKVAIAAAGHQNCFGGVCDAFQVWPQWLTNNPPVAACQNVVMNADGNCQGVVLPAQFDNGSSDLDNDPLSFSVTPSGPYGLGTTNVVLTVSDGAASSTCNATVTVSDLTVPLIVCPANIIVSTSVSTCDAVVSWTAPSATDNCAAPTTTSTHTPGATFAAGSTMVTYTAIDASSNTSTCSFTVQVDDSVAPVAACQADTVSLDANGNGSTTAGAVDNGSTDNCGIATIALSQTAFTCADAGTNTVTFSVTDNSGNTSTCTAVVTVVPTAVNGTATADTMLCGFNVSCNGNNGGVAHATATGGCPGYSFIWSSGGTTDTEINLGAGTYTVTITDGAGGIDIETVTLTEPAPITATGTITNSCFGASTGDVDLTVTGGNGCQGYLFHWGPNGPNVEDLTNYPAGTYFVEFNDLNGCTGTETFTIGTLAALNPAISAAGNVLTSGVTWSSYQWYLNGNNIPGANASSYTATVTGSYSLGVTDGNGCTAVTNTINVTIVGISDPTVGFIGLSIYPNPARGEFKLLSEQPITERITVSIYDMFGHRCTEQVMPSLGREIAFDINAYSAGPYVVEVVSKSGQRKVFRLTVQ